MASMIDGRLAGKVCLVTGAAGGLGSACAQRMAEEGALVVCADLHGSQAVADAITASGGKAQAIDVDVSSMSQMEAMGARILSDHGRIDFAFANAGLPSAGSVVTVSEDDWNKVIAVNLTGVFLTMRAVAPAMIAQKSGSIVATASVAAFMAFESSAAYAASKGGVIALARQAAADLGSYGIRVNAIAPGMVPTGLLDRTIELRGGAAGVVNATRESVIERTAQAGLLGRVGTPGEIASLIVFLASDESQWITGQTITIDGGLSAR